MSRNRDRVRRARAFTLVELLTVVGIVSVLIGIFLPAIARVRQDSQKLKCSVNLRNLGQFLFIHANDHQGYLPLAGNILPGTDDTLPDNPHNLCDDSQQKYVYYDNGGGVICATAMPAALAPCIISRAVRSDSWEDVDADIQAAGALQNAFICPSDALTIDRTYGAPQWIKNYASATYLNGWTSYGINAEVFAWTDNGVGSTTGHSRCRGKLSIVPHPEQTMLMCDTNAAIEIWVLGPQLSLGDVYLGTGVTVGSGVFDLVRHRGMMNVLFADGHVESVYILTTGSTLARGAVGSPGNTPSGDLMAISMDKDFQ